MPIFRYFLVMGCCLLGLIVACGWMWPNTATSESIPVAYANPGSASASLGSLADWRRSEHRLARPKDKAIVYPDVATLDPTPARLAWESQLKYLPENHVYEARAEMPPAEAPKVAEKVAEKKTPVHKHVARAQTNARIAANMERQQRQNLARTTFARNNNWDPFGLFD
jgi:hypothetical protein